MDELELRPFHREVAELIEHAHSPGRHSARSAIRSLQKAWRLRYIDRELAAFALITADEEAITAIMHALKRRNYPGADRLRTYNHNHKWAFIPFLKAMTMAFQAKEGTS